MWRNVREKWKNKKPSLACDSAIGQRKLDNNECFRVKPEVSFFSTILHFFSLFFRFLLNFYEHRLSLVLVALLTSREMFLIRFRFLSVFWFNFNKSWDFRIHCDTGYFSFFIYILNKSFLYAGFMCLWTFQSLIFLLHNATL